MRKNMKFGKNFLAVAAALVLAFTLAGCDSLPGVGSASLTPVEDVSTTSDGRETGGYAVANLGEEMRCHFFEFTVNSAYRAASYEGATPADGNSFVVLEVTVNNPYSEELSMYDGDFVLFYNDDTDDYSVASDYIADSQLPAEYQIEKGGSRTGDLVFEVPSESTSFSFLYQEIYEDDVWGNGYYVTFSL
ncbi:MAG: hypothetical protein PWQ08_1144 [Clostridiales bacterium]|nr:hypothetical protein [Clostridiales bacterium]